MGPMGPMGLRRCLRGSMKRVAYLWWAGLVQRLEGSFVFFSGGTGCRVQ